MIVPLFINFKQFIARRLSQYHPSTNKSIDKMNIQTYCRYRFPDEYKETFENVLSLVFFYWFVVIISM